MHEHINLWQAKLQLMKIKDVVNIWQNSYSQFGPAPTMTNVLLDESDWMYQTLKYPPVKAEPAHFSDIQMHILYLNEHTCWWSNLFQTHYLNFASL